MVASTTGHRADLNRLRRIEGQVRGLQRLVEEDAYCIDILTQISAATRALENVALSLLDEHLHLCVADAAGIGDPNAEERLRAPPRPSPGLSGPDDPDEKGDAMQMQTPTECRPERRRTNATEPRSQEG